MGKAGRRDAKVFCSRGCAGREIPGPDRGKCGACQSAAAQSRRERYGLRRKGNGLSVRDQRYCAGAGFSGCAERSAVARGTGRFLQRLYGVCQGGKAGACRSEGDGAGRG